MDLKSILYPILFLGITGSFFGVILSVASKIFYIKQDPKVIAVRNALPGANCGACGFPGCDGMASAICSGKAPVNGCVIGGNDTAEKIAELMGVNAGNVERNVACVLCQGACGKAKNKYDYHDLVDCRLISDFQKGQKACTFGCCGGGTCVSVCEFDAIHMVNGVAQVDKEKCVACMKCINICPKGIIKLVPYKSKTVVKCMSNDVGKIVRANCNIGCISCKMCEKNCPKDAIHVEDNLARIDYEKCINCCKCVSVCPTGAIFCEYPDRVAKMKEREKERKQKEMEAKKLAAQKAKEETQAAPSTKTATAVLEKEENK